MEEFPYISFVPDKKTVLRRLGSQKATFPAGLDADIDALIAHARSAFFAKGRAKLCTLERSGEDIIVIDGQAVESRLLSKMLKDSTGAYLMCATIPQRAVDGIGEAIRADEGLKAIVFDAYASECVDGALDVIMERKNAGLKRTGQHLTKHRFSAGYGDLDIRWQKVFYGMLSMETLGVHINDQFLLSPEKSVIAVAGVE
ncbi:MAG: hypothetical protein AAGU77_14185 [Bacillota bacterium]